MDWISRCNGELGVSAQLTTPLIEVVATNFFEQTPNRGVVAAYAEPRIGSEVLGEAPGLNRLFTFLQEAPRGYGFGDCWCVQLS